MTENKTGERGTRTLGVIFLWIAVLFVLSIPLGRYLDSKVNPNTDPVSTVSPAGEAEVVLAQNRLGHYVASGRVNGQPVEFLLDTGATTVSVPESVASKIGLTAGAPQQVLTAKGAATVYGTFLDSVVIGNISIGNVRAHINPHMPGEKILLGMSFLRHLEMLQSGGSLTLRLPISS